MIALHLSVQPGGKIVSLWDDATAGDHGDRTLELVLTPEQEAFLDPKGVLENVTRGESLVSHDTKNRNP